MQSPQQVLKTGSLSVKKYLELVGFSFDDLLLKRGEDREPICGRGAADMPIAAKTRSTTTDLQFP